MKSVVRTVFILVINVLIIARSHWWDEVRDSFEFGQLDPSTERERQFNDFQGLNDIPVFKSAAISTSAIPFSIQSHGTTTLAFKHGESVIVCVDSKASIGSYVGSRCVKKVFPISSTAVATMAGGAADCAFWIRQMSHRAKLLEHRYGMTLGVQARARLLADTLREYRGRDLSVGTMVAGWDTSGPGLFYVDSEGACVSGDLFCVGSGAQGAYSVLDAIPSLSSQSLEMALDSAISAVRHASYRDGYSGGYVTALVVNVTGIFPIIRRDVRTMPMHLPRPFNL
jgi:20S proteasome subunit beta 5